MKYPKQQVAQIGIIGWLLLSGCTTANITSPETPTAQPTEIQEAVLTDTPALTAVLSPTPVLTTDIVPSSTTTPTLLQIREPTLQQLDTFIQSFFPGFSGFYMDTELLGSV